MASETALIDAQLLDAPVESIPFDPFPQPAGAECVFFGRTRDETHPTHGRLTRIEYEAYRPLAERTLHDLAAQTAARFGCLGVRIHHAIGPVAAGEASVVVQVVAGHRREAFEACRWLMDELKRSVPIWKREIWSDATTWSDGTKVDHTDIVS